MQVADMVSVALQDLVAVTAVELFVHCVVVRVEEQFVGILLATNVAELWRACTFGSTTRMFQLSALQDSLWISIIVENRTVLLMVINFLL